MPAIQGKLSDIVILTVGRILLMLTSIVSTRIFTTLLSPGEIGRFNIILAICGLFIFGAISPVGNYVNRKLIEWKEEGNARKHLISLGKYLLILAVAAAFIIFLIQKSFGIGINIQLPWLLFLVFGGTLFSSGNIGYISYLNLLGRRFWFVLLTVLTLWLGLGISTYLVLHIFADAEHWLLGLLIGQLFFAISAFLLLFKLLGKSTPKIKVEKDKSFTLPVVFRFAWPLSISTFLYWLHTQGYRFIIEKATGIEILGFFAVGFGIGVTIMFAFDSLFNEFYSPIFYSQIAHSDNEKRIEAWNKYAANFFPALILIAVFAIANNSLIAHIFTTPKFHWVGYIIVWGVLCESCRMMASIVGRVTHAQFETKKLILPGVLGVTVALGGMFFLINWHPFNGPGLALFIGWLISLLFLMREMRKLLPITFPWERVTKSLLISLPIILISLIAKSIIPHPAFLQTVLILIVGGIYLVGAELFIAKEWLLKGVKITFIK